MFTDGDPRLGKLLEGIVRLAAGELHSRIEVSPARDELDAVIMGTNLLAEDLQIIYEELEQRVEVRTKLLHEAHLEMQKMASGPAHRPREPCGPCQRPELGARGDEQGGLPPASSCCRP